MALTQPVTVIWHLLPDVLYLTFCDLCWFGWETPSDYFLPVLKQIKVLIHCLPSQAVHSHIGCCVSFTEGELWLPLHKSPEPPIRDPI